MTSRMDVLVVGAGPAGTACARQLALLGGEVVLVHDPTHASSSIETLQPGSTGVVTSVLGPVLEAPHRPVAGVRSCWGEAALHETDYLLDPSDDSWAVDRAVFDASARQQAELAGVRIMDGRLAGIDRDDHGWRVDIGDGPPLECGFVVDATGRAAAVARRLNGQVLRRDSLVAMVAECTRGEDARDGTLIEAVENGWWYATTLGDRVSVGWVTEAELLPTTPVRADVWCSELAATRYLRHAVGVDGATLQVSTRRADSSLLDQSDADGWLAVGDAAAAWDPLSSQGLIAGILMGGRAAHAIAAGAEGVEEWCEDLRMLAEDTWALQSEYYRLEPRWSYAPFWSARQVADEVDVLDDDLEQNWPPSDHGVDELLQ